MNNYILGAIAGDVIGSVFEWDNVKTTNFPLFRSRSSFTDDTVLTVATMDAIINKKDYTKVYQSYGRRYPMRGYGGNFKKWLITPRPKPYNSWGNGSAMRVSPIGWAFDTIEEVLGEAKKSAEVTHNHPEGIKGAQAVSAAIFLARTGESKRAIKTYIETMFDYDLDRTIEDIRPDYTFDVSCQGSVPESIIAFLESTDYESTIRLAISIGGDSDTIACIAGSIAQAFYKEIPNEIVVDTMLKLPGDMVKVVREFSALYNARMSE